jgi:hypothetical protein
MSGVRSQSGNESGQDSGVKKGYASTEALGSPPSEIGITPYILS